ncbi:MAG: 4Fe-4S binding protein [Clostridia bacterium]|jgi:NAD-dependent dihydropyrimidine dehydrogenase PreA subunit|nr:4Fe-4S binding protein [Clostridia bacterium]MBT7122983.1 4Fe-4S binding protein [Clostridia bacterium]
MKHRYIKNVATLELDEGKCTNCEICIEVCPHNVFDMVNQNFTVDKKLGIVDLDACMECGACVVNCPFGALDVNAGVGCAYAVVRGMIMNTEPNCDCSPDDDVDADAGDEESGCC